VSASLERLSEDTRLMSYTAAAMYGGAVLDATLEVLLPGDPRFAIAPAIVAAFVVVALIAWGSRLPRRALAALGPIGVLLIAYSLTETVGAGDGAVLYVWPVLWSTFFFGRRGAIAIVLCVALAHAGTLLLLPPASSYPGRWLDVVVPITVVAVVVLQLLARNDQLLGRLAAEARADALTGLANRRGFDERAALELARARRDGQSLALAVFDIDYFKRVNDEWGHDVGDRVLVRVGRVLDEHSRDIDLAARLGGEEFAVLMPGCDLPAAESYAERLRTAVAGEDRSGLPTVRLSAGVDAAIAPASIEELLQAADSALYRAKRTGRDRTVSFERGRDPRRRATERGSDRGGAPAPTTG
jgi:diguanylate cyclase (GGDEF)-like protein